MIWGVSLEITMGISLEITVVINLEITMEGQPGDYYGGSAWRLLWGVSLEITMGSGPRPWAQAPVLGARFNRSSNDI